MPYNDVVLEALQRLDTMETTITDWEVDFLESLLHQSSCTAKQCVVLARMVEKYFPGDALATALRGRMNEALWQTW